MRSTTGEHWIALDQIRALACFMVFAFHFCHGDGTPLVPFAGAPAIFPLAVIDEGHTGVALFMTLAGYLFAKLLDGRTIRYLPFFFNRALRLLPLLVIAILLTGIEQALTAPAFDPLAYAALIGKGLVLPTWPSGGWSITVEMHFYVLLPLLLAIGRRSRVAPLLVVAAAIALRAALFAWRGEVQWLAYYTIVGRIDQFALGMLAFHLRSWLRGRHALAAGTALGFCAFYWLFDRAGGFFEMGGSPSPSPLWIAMPTIEGASYALLVAWYDASFTPSTRGISGMIGRIGAYSYSIYLLHFFVVFRMGRFIERHIMAVDSFGVALAWSVLGFAAMVPIGWASFHWIERRFLHLRRRYAVPAPSVLPKASYVAAR